MYSEIKKNLEETSHNYSRLMTHINSDETFAIIGSQDKDDGSIDHYKELLNAVKKMSLNSAGVSQFNDCGTFKSMRTNCRFSLITNLNQPIDVCRYPTAPMCLLPLIECDANRWVEFQKTNAD